MSLTNNQKELKLAISKHSKSIRAKFIALKRGQLQTEHDLVKTFKPITNPLHELVSMREETPLKKDMEPKYEPELEPAKTSLKPAESDLYLLEKAYGHVSAPYLKKLMNSRPRGVDSTYGLKYMKRSNTFKIGNSPVQIRNDHIYIKDAGYIARPGLYELLVMNNPDCKLYNDYDLQTYKDILLKSNAHKSDYNADGNVNRSELSDKYNRVIARLFPKSEDGVTTKTGKGIVWKDAHIDKKMDYKYWSDPNELIERLKLLLSSSIAGNTSHNNEIQEILTELREADIIQ